MKQNMKQLRQINQEEMNFLIQKRMEDYNINKYQAKESVVMDYYVAQEILLQ